MSYTDESVLNVTEGGSLLIGVGTVSRSDLVVPHTGKNANVLLYLLPIPVSRVDLEKADLTGELGLYNGYGHLTLIGDV